MTTKITLYSEDELISDVSKYVNGFFKSLLSESKTTSLIKIKQ